MAEEREIIFEFLNVGGSVKVTAVDVASGTEVSIIGDPAASETVLKHMAKRKLDYVLGKQKD